MRVRSAWLMAVLALTLCACNERTLTPKSGGRPYEVVVVDDDNGVVARQLQAEAEVLPQSEPQFDVRAVSGKQYNIATQTSRSIVVTAIDPKLSRTTVRYEYDVVARPQLIVYLTAPSSQRLHDDAHLWGPQLRKLFNSHERNIAIAHLRANRNIEAERRIEKMFGATMLVPADLRACKEGNQFLWFSTNTVEDMRNICLYTIPESGDFATLRDSVMRVNIPGETDNMHMTTRRESLREERGERREERGERAGNRDIPLNQSSELWRGLWEMENDAMGGPFTAIVVNDMPEGRRLVAEAFVYAPETTKRNKLRLTEAALYTLRTEGGK